MLKPAPRIAIVTAGLGAGGAEKTVSQLASAWTDQGRQVTVITLEPQSASPYHLIDSRVRVERLELEPRLSAPHVALRLVLLRIVRLRRALKAAAPDVILAFLTRTNVLTLIASAGLGVPVIVSERNNPALQKVGAVWRTLRSVLYRRARVVTALTKEALDYYPPAIRDRGMVIPCAFPMPAEPAPRQGQRTLVAVGRLDKQKGFDLLLEAFARIAPEAPDWSLVIWGEGAERGALEQLRDRLGLGDRVRLPGVSKVPYGWIADAHAFVLSSRYEGLANVVGEAMAAGLPVVAFDCNWGPREFIRDGETGILVPPNDVQGLADAMLRLMRDENLRDRFAAAARQSMRRFLPEHILPLWETALAASLPASGRQARGASPAPAAGQAELLLLALLSLAVYRLEALTLAPALAML